VEIKATWCTVCLSLCKNIIQISSEVNIPTSELYINSDKHFAKKPWFAVLSQSKVGDTWWNKSRGPRMDSRSTWFQPKFGKPSWLPLDAWLRVFFIFAELRKIYRRFYLPLKFYTCLELCFLYHPVHLFLANWASIWHPSLMFDVFGKCL
jgi:hypothetical protein